MGRGGAIKKPRIRVSKSDNHKDIGQNGQNGVESCNAGMQPVEATFFHHALLNRAMKSLKYQKWYTRWFGIGEEGENYGHSRLIHPFSPFTKGVTVLSSCLLLYSAVSSAFAAGFFWTADSCVKTPTLYFDAVVDSFFLFEILLNFFTGTFIHNEYVDDLRRVTRSYMKRSFVFDLITSIPASYVELATIKACTEETSGGGGGGGDQSFRLIRMLKPVRLLKILRTFRAISMLESEIPSTGVISRILRSFRLPSNITRILKVLLVIALIEHASASMFWLVKEHSNTSSDVLLFLQDNGVFTCDDYYWSSPCLLDKYVIATYFVVTIFSTIGFGDISGSNTEERIYCILLAYIAALAFGALLAEIQDAVMQMNQQQRDLSSLLNRVTDYLREKDVPSHLEKRVLSWIKFKHETSVNLRNEHDLVRALPGPMAFELRVKLHESLLMGIPLFAKLQSDTIERFVVQVWDAMTPLTFPELVPIFKASNSNYQEGLYLVVTGTAIMVLSNGRTLSTLHPGNSFGEEMLLVKSEVRCDEKPKIELWSVAPVMCMFISSSKFDSILKVFGGDVELEVNEQRRISMDAIREYGDPNATVAIIRWKEIVKQLVRRNNIQLREKESSTRTLRDFRKAINRTGFSASKSISPPSSPAGAAAAATPLAVSANSPASLTRQHTAAAAAAAGAGSDTGGGAGSGADTGRHNSRLMLVGASPTSDRKEATQDSERIDTSVDSSSVRAGTHLEFSARSSRSYGELGDQNNSVELAELAETVEYLSFVLGSIENTLDKNKSSGLVTRSLPAIIASSAAARSRQYAMLSQGRRGGNEDLADHGWDVVGEWIAENRSRIHNMRLLQEGNSLIRGRSESASSQPSTGDNGISLGQLLKYLEGGGDQMKQTPPLHPSSSNSEFTSPPPPSDSTHRSQPVVARDLARSASLQPAVRIEDINVLAGTSPQLGPSLSPGRDGVLAKQMSLQGVMGRLSKVGSGWSFQSQT